jgi:hypothetical protein
MLSPLRPLPFFVFLVSFVVNLPFVVPNGGRVFNDGWMAFHSDDPPLQEKTLRRYAVRRSCRSLLSLLLLSFTFHSSLTTYHSP